jgi:hypothetical protein
VIRTCLPGIVTGSLLAIARAAGETAPLLFTALGSQYLSRDLAQPMAALPLSVYTYAIGPYEEWHRIAWAAALVLILVVLVLSIATRLATSGMTSSPRFPSIDWMVIDSNPRSLSFATTSARLTAEIAASPAYSSAASAPVSFPNSARTVDASNTIRSAGRVVPPLPN